MSIFKDNQNEFETPTVYCDVKNCVYHKGEDICTAGRIRVGPSHAISSYDTLCDTFKPESK
ncbi:MAG TPA: DUF1540 domain-containing protein [Candidatus Avimonas sp.]|jgi:hypothetical protein|nr:DUF1540 domain-containing protein [Clostridiales bacterium]HOB35963.1 DUF1540 domain-containing protein [Candidatus Avimonas sp.]HQA15866.1 DUF1540 domain-containing protein [Candidatus Avimonas sp.]HQD37399.1 DUF1540 domain-containing protein [Candidatus Avimonas sp.]